MNHCRVLQQFIRKVNWLSGDDEPFSLERRLVISVSLYSFVGSLIAFCTTFFIELGAEVRFINALLIVFFAITFYMVRFVGYAHRVIVILTLFFNALISVLWFFNGGTNGPIAHILVLGFIIFQLISRHYVVNGLFFLVLVGLLIGIENFYPQWITPYQSYEERLIDIFIGLIIVVLVFSFIVKEMKQQYKSERIKVEQQRSELSTLTKVQNTMLSIIAHDFRAPLASIKDTLGLMAYNEDATPEVLKNLSEALAQEVDDSLMLLNNLLYWSQSQLEGTKLRLTTIEVSEYIHKNLRLLRKQASKKGIGIVADVPANLYIEADRDMADLILRNLISNAVKFSHSNSTISVNARVEGAFVCISVTDEGIGIPEEVQKNLFTMNTASTEGLRKEKGNGLGLLLCKDFVLKNGGDIKVQSKPGVGSTFSFTLPAEPVRDSFGAAAMPLSEDSSA